MANRSNHDSGGSQFFINVGNNTFLDWWDEGVESKHPVFGKIVEGMDRVMAISNVATKEDNPTKPIRIESVSVDGLASLPSWAESMPRDELYLTPLWLRTHPGVAPHR